MNIVSPSITPRQWMFVVATFVQGSILQISTFLNVTEQSSWVPVLGGYLLGLVMVAVYLKLTALYPGKNLMEINGLIFGKVLGKAVSVLYMFFFFSVAVLNLSDTNHFVSEYLLPSTPDMVIAALLMLACILAVRKGIDAIARYGAAVGVIQIVITITLTLLAFKDVRPSNILPLFDFPFKAFVQGTHTALTFSYLDVLALLMVVPNAANAKENRKSFVIGFSIGAAVLMLIVLVITGIMGPLMGYFSAARFETVRYINVIEIFSRMDTLFALALIVMRFFKISVLLYASVLAFSQICELKTYMPLSSVLGALAACASLFVFRSAGENADWGRNVTAVYSSLFEIILPVLTLLLYYLRGLVKKRRTRTA